MININVEYVCAFVATVFFLSSLISVGKAAACKVGPLACLHMLAWMEMVSSDKRTSLEHFRINYCRKKFYSTCCSFSPLMKQRSNKLECLALGC
jgi:hypothetical protein